MRYLLICSLCSVSHITPPPSPAPDYFPLAEPEVSLSPGVPMCYTLKEVGTMIWMNKMLKWLAKPFPIMGITIIYQNLNWTRCVHPHTIRSRKKHWLLFSSNTPSVEPDTGANSTAGGLIVGHFWHRNARLSARVVRVKDVKVCKNPCSRYSDFSSLSREASTVSTLGTSWWFCECVHDRERETTLEKY